MTPDDPRRPGLPVEPDLGHLAADLEGVTWTMAPPPRPKFQHNYLLHLGLFGLTFLTTTWVGASLSGTVLTSGLWYSIPLLVILSAHEFGHYFACRYYNVDASLPYYLPSPFPLLGTFGAVIRIREPFPSKKALFDIGVAGPIAGFVALIPFLLVGIQWSTVARVTPGSVYFGEPLMWKALERLYFGRLAPGTDVFLHPMGIAAWWGIFATALNLLPFAQMDGGHIAYAAVGRRSRYLSMAVVGVVALLALGYASWRAMAVIMIGVSVFFGVGHPRVIDEDAPLDPARQWVTVAAIAIFIVTFMPVPISFDDPF